MFCTRLTRSSNRVALGGRDRNENEQERIEPTVHYRVSGNIGMRWACVCISAPKIVHEDIGGLAVSSGRQDMSCGLKARLTTGA